MVIAGRRVDIARSGLIEVVVFGLLPAVAYGLRWVGDHLSRTNTP